jgi:HK97 family phage major capsid protein
MRSTDEILADMAALLDGAAGRDLTDDEINQWETLDTELKASQLAEARSRATDTGSGSGDGSEPAPEPAPAATAAARRHASASIRAQHRAYNTVVVPPGRPASSPRPQDSLDRAFSAYLRTGRPNADMEQLRAPQNAQGTGTGSAGGFLVPEGFLNRIVEVVKTFGGVFNDAEQLTTDSGQVLPFPTSDDTGNQAGITPEGGTPSSGSDIVFGQVQLGAYEYTASGASGNALALPIALTQDSAIDIDAFVSRILGRRIARKMAYDAVLGSGAGQAQGVAAKTADHTTASTTLAYDDLVDIVTGHLDANYWPGAKWYMNQSSFGQVMKLEDASDQLIFRPGLVMIGEGNATAISGQIQVGPILAPVVIDPAFATFAASAKWAVFGDMGESYIWRQVRQIEVLVDPYSSANKRQINYNAFVRADGRQKNTVSYALSQGHA